MIVELQRREDLTELLEKSKIRPILIFKHSTQCSRSEAVYEDEFLTFAAKAGDVPCGVVLVLENRALSNTIESEFGIRHESPQAIVVKDGSPTWNASHWAITADALDEALRA